MRPLAEMTPQQRRVHKATRSFRGVTQVDFDPPNVIDGGKPIKRVAGRVEELEHDFGLIVDRIGWRHKCRVYRLNTDAEGSSRGRGVSSHRSAPAAPLNAGFPVRWFCHATKECLRAGALDGETCPRGADHKTHREFYLDFRRPQVDAERLAA